MDSIVCAVITVMLWLSCYSVVLFAACRSLHWTLSVRPMISGSSWWRSTLMLARWSGMEYRQLHSFTSVILHDLISEMNLRLFWSKWTDISISDRQPIFLPI